MSKAAAVNEITLTEQQVKLLKRYVSSAWANEWALASVIGGHARVLNSLCKKGLVERVLESGEVRKTYFYRMTARGVDIASGLAFDAWDRNE